MTIYEDLRRAIREGSPIALTTVIAGEGIGNRMLVRADGSRDGSLGHPELDRVVGRDTLAELEAGRSGVRRYGVEGQATPEDLAADAIVSVFVESFAPPPQMWVFGAVDFTAALARVGKVLGYRVIVCDACLLYTSDAADE